MNCIICNTPLSNAKRFTAREMMIGLRHSFEYAECPHCGTLQNVETPADMAPYYGHGYYSFAEQHQGIIKRFLKRKRAQWAFEGSRAGVVAMLVGSLMVKRYGVPDYVRWMQRVQARQNSAILDVGCGKGALLVEMQNAGFVHLQGIDPFLASDIQYDNGVEIFKRTIDALPSDSFDVVMMHHSLEHVPDPQQTMQHLYRIVKPQGYGIIRIPVLGFAWRHYGVDWVQLDAPRHYFLPTLQALHMLAESAGFTIRGVEYDSTAFQFWGSEQYRQNIPLHAAESFAVHRRGSLFTKEQLHDFHIHAKDLNEQQDGDMVCMYVQKLPSSSNKRQH